MSFSIEFEVELCHLIVGGIVGYFLIGIACCWIQSHTRYRPSLSTVSSENPPYGVTVFLWPLFALFLAIVVVILVAFYVTTGPVWLADVAMRKLLKD